MCIDVLLEKRCVRDRDPDAVGDADEKPVQKISTRGISSHEVRRYQHYRQPKQRLDT